MFPAKKVVLPLLEPLNVVKFDPPVAKLYVAAPATALKFRRVPLISGPPDTLTSNGDPPLVATWVKSMASNPAVPLSPNVSEPAPAMKSLGWLAVVVAEPNTVANPEMVSTTVGGGFEFNAT